jgi:uncharacterized membrane protein
MKLKPAQDHQLPIVLFSVGFTVSMVSQPILRRVIGVPLLYFVACGAGILTTMLVAVVNKYLKQLKE